MSDFKVIEQLAIRSRRKSKHPICDFIECVAGELDPEHRVVDADTARQIEFNAKVYLKERDKAIESLQKGSDTAAKMLEATIKERDEAQKEDEK